MPIAKKSKPVKRAPSRSLVDEHHRLSREQTAAQEAAERNERALRQFLMYLFFFILAVSVIWKDRINGAASQLYEKTAGLSAEDPRMVTYGKAKVKIEEINVEVAARQGILDELVGGLGGEAVEIAQGDVTKEEAKMRVSEIAAIGKHRQEVLNEIAPGVGGESISAEEGTSKLEGVKAISRNVKRRRQVVVEIGQGENP
ncbi:MAG: hypothetical protein O3A51_00460 [Verrucomicrobia bacterium]|nr:hypothetical protein [Verrucomicrobiota bacterium]